MVDCKCCKNLFGFAASRPPCFVFTVCLAAFAIGLFSLGYFVQVYGWADDVDDIKNKEWHAFMNHLGSSEFCIFGNESFWYKNKTNENSTNLTSQNPTGFAMVVIPKLDLSITPSDGFRGVVNNVTKVKVQLTGKELGLLGFLPDDLVVNVTMTLIQPWYMDCHKDKCKSQYIETCGAASVPNFILPQHLLSTTPIPCNMSSDANIVEMVTIYKGSTTIVPMHERCGNGIKVETSLPLKDQRTPTRTMSLVDASAVNLRLQYSSYFLFVLVITCVLYGMIKGRPGKQNSSKKSMLSV